MSTDHYSEKTLFQIIKSFIFKVLLDIYGYIKKFLLYPVNTLSKLYRGDYSIEKSFWWFCVLGQVPLTLMMIVWGWPLFFFFRPKDLAPIGIAYFITAFIGVWKSADKHKKENIHSNGDIAKMSAFLYASFVIWKYYLKYIS